MATEQQSGKATEVVSQEADNSAPRFCVAYLGPPSSYTHQAAVDNFDQQHFQLEAQPSIAEVFSAVQDGNVTYGVVPFENSSNGAVVQTLDLFGDRLDLYPEVYVSGEAFVAVHHCLLGYSDSTLDEGDPESGEATPTRLMPSPAKAKVKPRRRVQHIRKVYSHPQAFGQCEAFLSVHLRNAERQEVSSTSRAAQIVADDATKTTAAISSRMAAHVHDLEILAAGIEDRPDNETRFLVLRRGEDTQPEAGVKMPAFLQQIHAQSSNHNLGDVGGCWKSLVSFNIKHTEPGALSRVLNLFRDYELNLTSVNSRPSRGRPWHYVFFVEFEGVRENDRRGKVDRALEGLKQVTEDCRWHGSWRKKGGI